MSSRSFSNTKYEHMYRAWHWEGLLPDASLRRFKSSGESFELDLVTMLSKLDTVSFSDSMVMAIPEDPNVDTVSAEVGHTHLTKQREEKINLVNVKG